MKSITQVIQNLVKPYIDRNAANIAPVETNASSASKAYSVGEQLIIGGVLKEVTSPIASGGAIITSGAGANVTNADDVSSEIQTLTNVIAPIEDGTNYSQTYTKGKQFYRNGSLYQVTASSVNTSTAIDTGSGGNAEAVSDIATQIFGITHQYVHGTSSVETGFTKTVESCHVVNGVKHLQLRFQSASGITGRTLVAKLTTDLRPSSTVYFVCACASVYGNKLTTPVTGYIETNGNITVGDSLESTSTNVKDINIVISYL